MSNSTIQLCGFCQRPVDGTAAFLGGQFFHLECTQSPASQRLFALESELAELRADKQRLDWLCGQNITASRGRHPEDGKLWLLADGSLSVGSDLRAAIDAARSADAKGGRCGCPLCVQYTHISIGAEPEKGAETKGDA